MFSSNAAGSRCFGVSVDDGAVFVLRGLITTRRVASSVVAFLQHLLA